MSLRRVVTLLVMSFAAACGDPLRQQMRDAFKPLEGKLPPCEIDVEASEVNVEAVVGPWTGFYRDDLPYTGDTLREDVAESLGSLCGESGRKPARFRLRGGSEGSNMTYISALVTPMNLIWGLLWLPTGGGEATLTLDYEYDGKIYTAKTNESVVSGYWYNVESAQAAFVDALEVLVDDVARQMGVAR